MTRKFNFRLLQSRQHNLYNTTYWWTRYCRPLMNGESDTLSLFVAHPGLFKPITSNSRIGIGGWGKGSAKESSDPEDLLKGLDLGVDKPEAQSSSDSDTSFGVDNKEEGLTFEQEKIQPVERLEGESIVSPEKVSKSLSEKKQAVSSNADILDSRDIFGVLAEEPFDPASFPPAIRIDPVPGPVNIGVWLKKVGLNKNPSDTTIDPDDPEAQKPLAPVSGYLGYYSYTTQHTDLYLHVPNMLKILGLYNFDKNLQDLRRLGTSLERVPRKEWIRRGCSNLVLFNLVAQTPDIHPYYPMNRVITLFLDPRYAALDKIKDMLANLLIHWQVEDPNTKKITDYYYKIDRESIRWGNFDSTARRTRGNTGG